MSQQKDPNQGEGDRASARRYDRNVREFIDEGKVDDAATEAKRFVEEQPVEAEAAEKMVKRGPVGGVSVDELVAKGHSLIDRVRPVVERAVGKIRKRFGSSQ
jgi:hypothetical protein